MSFLSSNNNSNDLGREKRESLKKYFLTQVENAGYAKSASKMEEAKIDALDAHSIDLLSYILLNTCINLNSVDELKKYELRNNEVYFKEGPFAGRRVPKKSEILSRPSKLRTFLNFLIVASFLIILLFFIIYLFTDNFKFIPSGKYRIAFIASYFIMGLTLEKLPIMISVKLKDKYFFKDMQPYYAVFAGSKLASAKNSTYTIYDIMMLPNGALINIPSNHVVTFSKIKNYHTDGNTLSRIYLNANVYDEFLTEQEYLKKTGPQIFEKIISFGIALIFIIATIILGYIYKNFHMDRNYYADSILIDYSRSNATGERIPDDDIDSDSPYSFGCNVTSFYACLENGDMNALGGHLIEDPDSDAAYNAKDYLENAWGIEARKSSKNTIGATDTIDDLIKYGTNSKYQLFVKKHPEVKEAAKEIIARYGKDFSAEDVINDTVDDYKAFENTKFDSDTTCYLGAAFAYAKHGENALAAYDLMRIYRITGLCYQIEFLSGPECMKLCYNMAQFLQKNYSGFKDIHEMYCYGQMFRLKEDTAKTKAEIKEAVNAISMLEDDGEYSLMQIDFNNELEKP